MIRNIIFDVGNVLVGYSPERLIKQQGYSSEERRILMDAMFKSPVWLLSDRGALDTTALIERFVQNAPGHEALIREAYAHVEESVWEFPYAKDWVKGLRERGYHTWVLSNYGQDLLERTRDKMKFLPYMDGTVFSCYCHMLKPEPKIFQYLCDTCQILPAESVFLDDTLANVEAARAFGIHGIHFESYEQASGQLETLLQLYEGEERMGYCCE